MFLEERFRGLCGMLRAKQRWSLQVKEKEREILAFFGKKEGDLFQLN